PANGLPCIHCFIKYWVTGGISWSKLAHLVPGRGLDLEHLRAEIREQQGCKRARQVARQIENANTAQRFIQSKHHWIPVRLMDREDGAFRERNSLDRIVVRPDQRDFLLREPNTGFHIETWLAVVVIRRAQHRFVPAGAYEDDVSRLNVDVAALHCRLKHGAG